MGSGCVHKPKWGKVLACRWPKSRETLVRNRGEDIGVSEVQVLLLTGWLMLKTMVTSDSCPLIN